MSSSRLPTDDAMINNIEKNLKLINKELKKERDKAEQDNEKINKLVEARDKMTVAIALLFSAYQNDKREGSKTKKGGNKKRRKTRKNRK